MESFPFWIPMIATFSDIISFVFMHELLTEYYMVKSNCNFDQASSFIYGSVLPTTHYVELLILVKAVHFHLMKYTLLLQEQLYLNKSLDFEKKKEQTKNKARIDVQQDITAECLG